MDNKKLKAALFIDAENIPAAYADKVVAKAGEFGELIIKRIYGGSKTSQIKDWSDKSGRHGIHAIINYVYSVKHNASDIAMAIDIMKVYYEYDIDVFVIATSDSDFSALIHELRERGKNVVGIGMGNASIMYKSLFITPYYELDNVSDNIKPTPKKDTHTVAAPKPMKKITQSTTQKNSNNGTAGKLNFANQTDNESTVANSIEKAINNSSNNISNKAIKAIVSEIDKLIAEKGEALISTLGHRLKKSKSFNFDDFYNRKRDVSLTKRLFSITEIKELYLKAGDGTTTALKKKSN